MFVGLSLYVSNYYTSPLSFRCVLVTNVSIDISERLMTVIKEDVEKELNNVGV